MSIDGVAPGGGVLPQGKLQEEAGPIKSKHVVDAGNLNGANLEISQSVTEKTSSSIGLKRPSLQSPSSDIPLKNYEETANVLNKLTTQLSVEQHAATFGTLANSINGTGRGDGGGGVLAATIRLDDSAPEQAKALANGINSTGTGKGGGGVLAATIRLNSSAPEQTKEWGDKLQTVSWELSTLGLDDSAAFEQTEVAIGKLNETLNNERSDDTEITKRLDDVQKSLEQGGFTFDSSKKLEHMSQLLDKLGPPLPADPKEINMTTTEKGLSVTLDDNKSLAANFEKKTMDMNIDGKKLEFNADSKGDLKATIDGKSAELNTNESRTFTDLFSLMALFHEMGTTMRRQHREGRNVAQGAVVGKIKLQAGKQREAAGKAFAAGMASAGAKVASGLVQIRGSAQALKAANKGSNALAESLSGRARGISSLIEGMGEAGASLGRYQSTIAESEGTLLRADEEQARFVKQTEQDQMEIAKEVTAKARETFSQVWNSIQQAQSRVAGNI